MAVVLVKIILVILFNCGLIIYNTVRLDKNSIYLRRGTVKFLLVLEFTLSNWDKYYYI